MEKEKRIEEMARLLCENMKDGGNDYCGGCYGKDNEYWGCTGIAELFYEEGYRKQEDILHEWVDRETAYLNEIAELKKENQRLKELQEKENGKETD